MEQVREWEVDASLLKVASMQALMESPEEEEPFEINFVSLFQQEVEMDRQRQIAQSKRPFRDDALANRKRLPFQPAASK